MKQPGDSSAQKVPESLERPATPVNSAKKAVEQACTAKIDTSGQKNSDSISGQYGGHSLEALSVDQDHDIDYLNISLQLSKKMKDKSLDVRVFPAPKKEAS